MSTHLDEIAFARTVVGPGPNVTEALQSTPRPVPSNVRNLTTVGLVIGVAAAAFGLFTETNRTMGVILTCLVYFIGVSQGGVLLSVASTVTLGRWQRPFKRIAESFGANLPILWALWLVYLVVGLLGGPSPYEWNHEEMHGHKAVWLNPAFHFGRQVVCLGILFTLDMLFIRNSLRPDLGAAAEQLGSRAPTWWSRFTVGWQGRTAEIEAAYQRNITLGPIIVVTYAITFTMFAVDAVMSLAPHWYANMFPAWIFVSSFWVSLSWVCIFAVAGGKWLKIDHLLARSNFHDLGKLMFGLGVFWAYTLFAQILPIWYGNMPEETGYLMLRIYSTTWRPLAMVVGAMCFLIPFSVLLSRGVKKMPRSLAGVGVVICTGIFLERFLLVMPQVWMEDSLPIGLVEIGVLIGFVSMFVKVVTTVLSQVPPVPFTDPFMNPNPNDVHVHPAGAHGHGEHAHA